MFLPFCHSHENGNPVFNFLDSRVRGNDNCAKRIWLRPSWATSRFIKIMFGNVYLHGAWNQIPDIHPFGRAMTYVGGRNINLMNSDDVIKKIATQTGFKF